MIIYVGSVDFVTIVNEDCSNLYFFVYKLFYCSLYLMEILSQFVIFLFYFFYGIF